MLPGFTRRSTILAAALSGAACLTLTQAGCTMGSFGSAGSGEVLSAESPVKLSPDFRVQVYESDDSNHADVFLTDLSESDLAKIFAEGGAWGEVEGQIVHVGMFLRPKPGRTPIEGTAASATVRYIVLARGEIGVYDGAGFLQPGWSPGSDAFAGGIKRATLRLTRATDRFRDLLGPSEFTLRFKADEDGSQAAELRARVEALSRYAQPVLDTTPEL